MPVPTPKIDPRTSDVVVKQTTDLLQRYTGWQPSGGQADMGSALVHIFGHLMEQVIERLNQVPEKNFLAFLDLIGTEIRPPRPARVSLTFQLATGSTEDALVPAFTQVAALPEEGEEDETVFETDRDLVVTRAQLIEIFVHEPGADRYSDNTPVADQTGGAGATAGLPSRAGAFAAFAGAKAIEHSLYLALDDMFTVPGSKTIYVRMNASDPNALDTLDIVWEYWDGRAWNRIEKAYHEAAWDHSQQTMGWLVTIMDPPIPKRTAVNGREAAWVRARLNTALLPGATPALDITITRIMAQISMSGNTLQSTRAFTNSATLDLSKDFYPFGEQPRLGDTFYLALPEACVHPGAFIYVNLTASDPLPTPLKPSSDLAITWETWNGTAWEALVIPGLHSTIINAFVSVELTLPATLAPRLVNNEPGYWLRARIKQGNYGTASFPKLTKDGKVSVRDDGSIEQIGGYGPPSIASVALRYVWRDAPFAACYSYNDFRYIDRTTAVTIGDTPFHLFTVSVEQHPALYCGFDQPFDNRPMTLYAQVDPPQPREIAQAMSTATTTAIPPRVVWEYWSAAGWHPLGAIDETRTFAESGVIRFVGPADFTAHGQFGRECYWLRARWEDGTFLVPPRLRRVLTNTTWATQAVTIQNEILGSSTGESNQRFRTSQTPVLVGQHLEVQEPDLPSAERSILEAAHGKDGITVVLDETGQPEEIWVRWQPVSDFHGSGPQDRHYVMDYLTGEVCFGDGQHGLVPPAGRNNVRMAQYRTSGGVRGNRPAQSITQLKTAIPSVESVMNVEPAEGGAAQESLEEVKERGPKALRHRGRAVTAQDIEDLASEASPEVARARVLMPMPDFDPLGRLPLPEIPFSIPQTGGGLTVTAQWQGDQTLTVAISGPGRGVPYAQQEGKSPLTLTYTVAPELFIAGDVLRITFVNPGNTTVASAETTITYGVGSMTMSLGISVEVRPQTDYVPRSTIRQAGQLELIILPRSLAPQPTPSLALIARVKEYILARCSPTLALQVTEPDWVEVTITARVVPVSFEATAGLPARVIAALERFLHPLSGGFDGQGWPFGRRPHLSDLYGVIEGVIGVRHVHSLSMVNVPSLVDIDPPRPGEVAEDNITLTRLANERRDRFLIFSGRHQITMMASMDETQG